MNSIEILEEQCKKIHTDLVKITSSELPHILEENRRKLWWWPYFYVAGFTL